MASNRREGGALNGLWEVKYTRQRPKQVYAAEDQREDQLGFPGEVSLFQYLRDGDKDNLIETLLKFSKDRLDPPGQYGFSSLRSYLESADITNIGRGVPTDGLAPSTIILDERRDPTDTTTTTRQWDSDVYLRYPPTGTQIFTKALDLPRLVQRLSEKRLENGAERRTLYVCDMTSSCAMAIIATAPTRSIPTLRSFFHNHLLFRPLFRASMLATFTLEFHIPYFALRQGPPMPDPRRLRRGGSQTHKLLPLARSKEKEAYFYEAQTSFILTGIDERLYSAICSVDTYFGGEQHRASYLPKGDSTKADSTATLDAPSGGLLATFWNPRQYWLAVQSHRLSQATKEWTELIDCFVDRLDHYERLFKLPDDSELTRTTELTTAESTIRLFRDKLASTIRAWEDFHDRKGSIFEVESVALYNWWQRYLSSNHESISELKVVHELMAQKLELFRSMRDGLVNASSFKESVEATRQGNMVGILTRMTVVRLSDGFHDGNPMRNTQMC